MPVRLWWNPESSFMYYNHTRLREPTVCGCGDPYKYFDYLTRTCYSTNIICSFNSHVMLNLFQHLYKSLV